ncbi:MAG TPA: dihydrolipoamide acetyltransferase family protein [Candidatus Dormibacteraeota bacterium]|nr:dihydrolipoamide acetyltransferase family protein [Candidatus Dormibacteraeota bacterium]
MSTFALPDLGEGLQQAEIIAWHVAEGDNVTADEPLVSVETDKAVVDIPSPRSGRVAHLLAKPGDRVDVGAGLIDFEEGPRADTGSVIGALPGPPAKEARAGTAPAEAKPLRVQASPAVRALARERGVDLSHITGTGPGGIITRDDLEHAVSARGAPPAGEPLTGIRRAMAENMARAHAAVAAATVWDQADIEAWWGLDHDATTRLIRAVVAACAAVPIVNAWYDERALVLRHHPRVDLGIAVDTPDGLIVPVLRDAGGRDAESLRGDVDSLKAAALARTLPLSDLRDPTITLSNFGTLAGRQAALLLVPPQVAIVGAGRIFLEAAPNEGGGVAFRHRLPLSVTFDHRVVTGGDAARFMKALIASLEQIP